MTRVGIDFLWTDEINSGRVNYIYSLISALKQLPLRDQPPLVVFYRPGSPITRIQEIGYPDIRFQQLVDGYILKFTVVRRLANLISRAIAGKNKVDVRVPVPADMVDCVIPCEHREFFRHVPRRIHWIVDFNCYHLPELYPEEVLQRHLTHIEEIIALDEELMFSSETVLQDFRNFFPHATNKTAVVRFAVNLPKAPDASQDDLLSRYGIRKPYAIVSNTFWPHKNHQVVLRALSRCLKRGLTLDVVVTGKEQTYLGDGYYREVKELVGRYQLEEHVRFLGLVDRDDQVGLLRHANMIVQPSRFEGWSTLVEEAKALGVPLILSDLPIHREQVESTDLMFDPDDDESLSKKMQAVIESPTQYQDCGSSYARNREEYGRDLLELIRCRGEP